MPFKSAAQRRFLHARHPEIAKRWEKEEKKESYKSADPSRQRAIRKRLMASAEKSTGKKIHKVAKYSPPPKKKEREYVASPPPVTREPRKYVGGPMPVTRDKPRKYVAL